MRGGHAVQIFIHGADQDLSPETVNRARCLTLFPQPLEHRNPVQIAAGVVFVPDGKHSARDGQLVRQVQEPQS